MKIENVNNYIEKISLLTSALTCLLVFASVVIGVAFFTENITTLMTITIVFIYYLYFIQTVKKLIYSNNVSFDKVNIQQVKVNSRHRPIEIIFNNKNQNIAIDVDNANLTYNEGFIESKIEYVIYHNRKLIKNIYISSKDERIVLDAILASKEKEANKINQSL